MYFHAAFLAVLSGSADLLQAALLWPYLIGFYKIIKIENFYNNTVDEKSVFCKVTNCLKLKLPDSDILISS